MRFLFITLIAFTVLIGVIHADNGDSIVLSDTLDFPEIYDGDWGKYPPIPISEKCPQPEYPQKALQDSIEGRVVVQLHVDSTGHVLACNIIQERPEGYGFRQAAEQAFVTWQFTPANLNGVSTDKWITFPFPFKLPK